MRHAGWLTSIAIAAACSQLPANASDPTGLLPLLGLHPTEWTSLSSRGLTFGGWISGGITVNNLSPSNNFNGPVTFGSRNGEPMLNQLYFFLERAIQVQGDHWDFGGRADFLYGTDAIYTQTYGSPFGTWDYYLAKGCNDENTNCSIRFYSAAVPQVYLTISAPVGNGLEIRLGHFYTPFGYEAVKAPDNFFYSHAYTMQYGEPFTHTGLLVRYPVTRNIGLGAGSATGNAANGCTWRRSPAGEPVRAGPCLSGGGWDGDFNSGLNAWSFMGSVQYTSDDQATQVSAKGTIGPTSAENRNDWGLISLILQQDFGENWHYVLQHDRGFADRALLDQQNALRNATWYGINQYLFYDWSDRLSVGIRAEWFRDQNGFRVCEDPGPTVTVCPNPLAGIPNGAGNSYYAVTAGLKWRPLPWVAIRPSVRFDKSADIDAFGYDPTNQAGTASSQVLVATDVIVNF